MSSLLFTLSISSLLFLVIFPTRIGIDAESFSRNAILLCFIISFVVLYWSLIWWLFKRLKATLNSQLSVYSTIENWANLSQISGDFQPLNGEDEISTAIARLQKQLMAAQNQDSHIEQMIRERALLDLETGVGNREFLNNRLDALLCEDDAKGVLLLIQFRECDLVQSLYGHQQALTLLETLIQAIKYRLRYIANYFIARRSEFEFAVLLPGFYASEVAKLCDRLLRNIQAVDLPIGVNSEEFFHIGVSVFNKQQTSYQIMAEADMALRAAQLQGPSQWYMYDCGEVDQDNIKGSLHWRTFLSHAIKSNAFVLFFQPAMASLEERVLHHEILLKVRDHQGALISARVFLPMAQKCGMSVDIDIWVFDHVCRLLNYEQTQHDDCSLNLSIDSLLSEKFQQYFIAKLEQYPKIANRLIIEISEYYLVSHFTELQLFLFEMNVRGVKLLADKVGQHIVSAHYLKTSPISLIKLHRSIVLNIHERPENQVFIQSVKTLCDQQHVAIYALGVEKIEEWQTLIRLGINGGQGHFFTEPVEQVAKAIHLP